MKLLELHFKDAFRESSFLRHKSVPESTKSSLTHPHVIETPILAKIYPELANSRGLIKHMVASPSQGATPAEILAIFGEIREKVLVFKSLFGAMTSDGYAMPPLNRQFSTNLEGAVAKRGDDYRQYDKPQKKKA